LAQAVDMVNYIMRLQGNEESNEIAQLKISSMEVDADVPPGVDYLFTVDLGNDKIAYYWLEVENNGEGLGKIHDGDKVVLSGHSLGGHLASLAQRLFPDLFEEAFTYNAPGFDPSTSMKLTDAFVEDVAALLPGASNGSFSSVSDKIHTFESESTGPGDDTSLVASFITGTPASDEIYIATEKNSHSMAQFSDDLGVQALFERLLPDSLTFAEKQATLTRLMESASHDEGSTNEELLESLSALLQAPDQTPVEQGEAPFDMFSPPDWQARISLNNRLIELDNILSNAQHQNLQLEVVSSTTDLASEAQAGTERGLAFRYALVNLNAFVVIGVDYSSFNENGELDALSPDMVSEQFFSDRAEFLVNILDDNFNDVTPGSYNPSVPHNYYYDVMTGREQYSSFLEGTPIRLSEYDHRVFGTSGNDSEIEGENGDDHLYGSSPKAFSPHRAVLPRRAGSRSLAA
jgi:pimeloyl-ACP methyl ester carboxylesterase